jgi:hypothetical protein
MIDLGNESWIGWAFEPAPVPPTPTNGQAPLWAPLPGTLNVVGHSKTPTGKAGLNNSIGRGIGMAAGAYRKRGLISPSIQFQFAPGSLGLIENCIRQEGETLPNLIIYEGVYGQWTNVYRGVKCANLEFDLGANAGQGGELWINGTFEAISRYGLTVQPVVTPDMLRALDTPLMWHDCRTFNVEDANGDLYGLREAIHNATISYSNTLQFVGQRPNYGDNDRFSRGREVIRESDIVVSGELTLTRKTPPNLVDAAANSQNWGNMPIHISDGPGLVDSSEGKGFLLTPIQCFPSDINSGGGETSSIRTHQIPFNANALTFEIDDDE